MTVPSDITKARGLWFGACKEAKISEEDRRAVQLRICAKESASKMTVRDFNACVLELKARGLWKPKNPGKKASTKPHVRKVWAIWRDMVAKGIPQDGSDAALRAFVARQTKSAKAPNGITDPEWLSPEEANKVTEGLKAWSNRELAKRGAAR